MEPVSEPASPTEDHSAGRRAREVYRFFRPERLAPISEHTSSVDSLHSPNPSCSPGSTSIRRAPSVSSASSIASQPPRDAVWAPLDQMPESLVLGDDNVTLNSFAQLAALRLDVDRVFISVSDRRSQFIIAQSAQTTAGNNKYDAMGDGVYTGRSTLDIGSWKMCKDTITMPPSNRGTGECSFLVSHDLREDDRYQHLPMVTEEPNFRFYAGTPLTTESNINLGCFFILDTKPRPDFTHKEREIMGHMSMLIMDFLKVSRQATEGRRAARLSQGLSRFVAGSSSFFDAANSPTADDHVPQTTSSSVKSGMETQSVEHLNRHFRRSPSRSNSVRSSSSVSENRAEPSVSCSLENPFPNWPHSRRKHEDLDKGNAWTFRRAANLIRESLELEGDSGVVFVEAPREPVSDLDSGSDASSSETGKPASVLAMSTEADPFSSDTQSHPVANLDDDFLHRLLGRYQKGRLWAFHRDGMLSSSDNESPRKSRARTRAPSGRSTGLKKRRTTENSVLNRCFPGATQVLFVPLWNAANSQWFGGFFCWNNVESNVFNPSVELSSLLGFGSSIMVECNRVESMISDRQKGDFLGSISHELRSPLHGILAAAELMQSTDLNSFQGSLMETIDACGRTLLDTMNQVLDFSKIISLEREFRHFRRRKNSSLDMKQIHRNAAHLDAYMATDVSVLAEEVVEGVCVGQLHGQDSKSADKLHPNVDVVIDIAPNDWIYHIPPGALRRIIMNIFSNSIKYTDQGNVSLHLEAKKSEPQRGQREDLVTLTVSDTGKGISEDFLRGKLYVPFAQENSLASGTGLGLSIVRSLVKSLGGSINVYSRPRDGTIVQVALPLMRPGHEDIPCEGPLPDLDGNEVDSTGNFRTAHRGKKVAIWGTEPEEASSHGYWGVTSRYLTDWYGFELVSSSREDVDLMLAKKVPSDDEIRGSPRGCITSPVLILNAEYMGHNSTPANGQSLLTCVSFVSHPCGPRKLARSIQKCLDQAKAAPLVADTITRPEQPDKSTTHIEQPLTKSPCSDGHSKTETSTPDSIPAEPPEPPKDPPTQSKTPRVLIVEDNKINLNLMLAFLKKRKLTTLDSAENGQLAVDAVKNLSHSYDIIFMDISMPVMDGFEATRAIRLIEKERAANLQPSNIIALTGLSSERDESQALESGMDLFLTKPVTLKSITKILDEWGEKGLQSQSRRMQVV
ncbi:hypothetical protein N7492_002076 [Penicillium capsulatum]|uniref:histidine kinase n=1 Tax=Penicillium capsulatum TaxID=69766 RepID=A0A9W9IKR3_9EURO|nr:hypothetical protein N7492_002076 [Penicillium capsulatum]KAJ6123310.1 hypothetical protein N7512_005775 [Penicillium capsulatum]